MKKINSKMGKEVDVAILAALTAGDFLEKNIGKIKQVDFKEVKDIVTNIDTETEKKIISTIKKNFPEHGIFAEESGKGKAESEYVWIIDPLDGTVNYSRGIPIYGVSIALSKGGEIIAGVIYLPSRKELFYAAKGKGAFMNGKKISVSKTSELSKAMFYTNDFNIFDKQIIESTRDKKNSHIITISKEVMRMRIIGSAVTELAYLASGRIDAYTMINFGYWDVAAGALITEEAGGKVSDFEGKPLTEKSKVFLATNGILHQKILSLLKK
ncbi:MAG: inositol monophosphatase family protein [archaeon]|jgi:myo-inositol-1(or 4)-monophosphatase